MKKFSLELPKFRLELHAKLVKRRKPLLSEPLVPSVKIVNKKYRTGTFVGKVVRHVSEHKGARRALSVNLAAFVIASSFLPFSQSSAVKADWSKPTQEGVIIQTQNTLKTEVSIQLPLNQFRLNQPFSIFHPGIDLGAEVGDTIKPFKAGKVVYAGFSLDGYGNHVIIDHGQGLTSLYAHMKVIDVKDGEDVTTDIKLGEVGMTGHTTGPHLHFEVRQDGIAQNPLYFIPTK